jgi:deferrochelatase/peroxidase EfeB
VRDLDQFEVIKTQMARAKNIDGSSPGEDAIHKFSKPVSGGYYYVPPVPEDGYVGIPCLVEGAMGRIQGDCAHPPGTL